MPPNQDKILECKLIKTLGATECENCPKVVECWGEETQLPEPTNGNDFETLWQALQFDFPRNCRECKAYDWGKCPFIYKSEACLIRRKERLSL